MDKHYFIALLHKHLKGKTTGEEQKVLFAYYDLFESENDLIGILLPEEKQELKIQMRSAIERDIFNKESHSGKVRRLGVWLKASAAAVLLIVGAAYLYRTNIPVNLQPVASQPKNIKENRLVRLPDGSTVIVSAGSKLNYASSFDGMNERKVYLEGQAYFDIKSNPSKPFIVYTGSLVTTVLGTAFNVKALPGEAEITVTVTRGKVKVSDPSAVLGYVTPNEQIVYDKRKAQSVQRTVEAESIVQWKEQDMLFDDVTVSEATQLLEERFKVKITFADSMIKSNRFTTTFQHNASLEQVLTSICEFNNANYQYNDDDASVVISSRKTTQ
jgi:ferric-dicitrate binding protein FerR (iron transport regulator)